MIYGFFPIFSLTTIIPKEPIYSGFRKMRIAAFRKNASLSREAFLFKSIRRVRELMAQDQMTEAGLAALSADFKE